MGSFSHFLYSCIYLTLDSTRPCFIPKVCSVQYIRQIWIRWLLNVLCVPQILLTWILTCTRWHRFRSNNCVLSHSVRTDVQYMYTRICTVLLTERKWPCCVAVNQVQALPFACCIFGCCVTCSKLTPCPLCMAKVREEDAEWKETKCFCYNILVLLMNMCNIKKYVWYIYVAFSSPGDLFLFCFVLFCSEKTLSVDDLR